MTRTHEPPKFSEELLVSLLKAADWLLMPDLAKWAVRRLIDEHDLTSIRRIALSQQFPILADEWLAASVGALVTTRVPITDLAPETSTLHSEVILKITGARETLEGQRKSLAYSLPVVGSIPSSSSCRNHNHCYIVWAKVWWGEVARRLLHPGNGHDQFLEFSNVLTYLHSLPFDGMNPECTSLFIDKVEQSGVLDVERLIMDGALKSVKKYLASLHGGIDEIPII